MLDGDDASADRWIARRAGPDDAETVRSISAEAYAASYLPVFGYLPAPAMEDYGAHVAAGEVWFVEDAEPRRPVGVVVLERHASHLLVYNLAVLPERWGEGIGRRLLALAEERARAVGHEEVRLFTNTRMTRNLSIYRRAGYRETGRRPHPFRAGVVLVDMSKRLEPI